MARWPAACPRRRTPPTRSTGERAERARLDYLALGDWHGTLEIAPRTWYAGTPEPDRFRANEPAMRCWWSSTRPAYRRESSGSPPPAIAGTWLDLDGTGLDQDDVAAAVEAVLPPAAERHRAVLRLRLGGLAGLATRAALEAALERAAGEFCRLDVLATIWPPSPTSAIWLHWPRPPRPRLRRASLQEAGCRRLGRGAGSGAPGIAAALRRASPPGAAGVKLRRIEIAHFRKLHGPVVLDPTRRRPDHRFRRQRGRQVDPPRGPQGCVVRAPCGRRCGARGNDLAGRRPVPEVAVDFDRRRPVPGSCARRSGAGLRNWSRGTQRLSGRRCRATGWGAVAFSSGGRAEASHGPSIRPGRVVLGRPGAPASAASERSRVAGSGSLPRWRASSAR